jgi:hypothetical protein
MASTITQLIAKFTQGGFYPSCDATTAESIFQDVYREVLMSIEIRTNTVTFNVTAGTADYDISENTIRILEAYWQTGASAADLHPLTQISLRELSITNPSFRKLGNGRPDSIYSTSTIDADTGKLQVGLYPVPSESTSGTYPRVLLYVTQYVNLTGSDTIPNSVLTDNLFLYGMAYQWAVRQDPEKAAYWQKLYNLELGKNQDHVYRLMNNAPLTMAISPIQGKQTRRP